MADAKKAIFVLITEHNRSFHTNITKEPISGSRSANYQKQAIMNRSSSVVTYSNSDNPTLEVSIELFAIHTPADEQLVIGAMNLLRNLSIPMQSGVQGPPLCKITLGDGYNGMYDNWPCVLTNVGEVFTVEAGFSKNLQSRVIGVKLSFMGVETDSMDWGNSPSVGGSYEDPDWSNVSKGLDKTDSDAFFIPVAGGVTVPGSVIISGESVVKLTQ